MSLEALTWAFKQKLPPTQRFVLVVLSNRHNADNNQCNPSIRKMSEDSGLSERSIYRILSELEATGILKIHARYKNGSRRSNQYSLNIEGLVFDAEEDDEVEVLPSKPKEIINPTNSAPVRTMTDPIPAPKQSFPRQQPGINTSPSRMGDDEVSEIRKRIAEKQRNNLSPIQKLSLTG